MVFIYHTIKEIRNKKREYEKKTGIIQLLKHAKVVENGTLSALFSKKLYCFRMVTCSIIH